MRRELLKGKTLREVAEQEGVSRQRISQLVGRLDRLARSRSLVESGLNAGLSDSQIAQTGLSRSYVALLRRSFGIKYSSRPNRSWTREQVLEKAREWRKRYGYIPAATDWTPSQARRLGHFERIKRYKKLKAPHSSTVLRLFGLMIQEADIPPPTWTEWIRSQNEEA